jgi:hypothetical protein
VMIEISQSPIASHVVEEIYMTPGESDNSRLHWPRFVW